SHGNEAFYLDRTIECYCGICARPAGADVRGEQLLRRKSRGGCCASFRRPAVWRGKLFNFIHSEVAVGSGTPSRRTASASAVGPLSSLSTSAGRRVSGPRPPLTALTMTRMAGLAGRG